MTRRLVLYGDPLLRQVCRPVDPAAPELPGLLADMQRIMRRHAGVGLAAPQVGVPWRIVVAAPSRRRRPLVLLDPVVEAVSDDRVPFTEGCLSFPGVYRTIRRPSAVEVRYLAPDGAERSLAADGLLARILLHEIDHLDGRLMVDHLSWWHRLDIDGWRRWWWLLRRREE